MSGLRALPLAPEPRAALVPERARLVRRARVLAWGGNAWHAIEFAVAVAAGVAAGSVALVGFGIDSLIESLAGLVIVWRFAAGRAHSDEAERRAQRLVAVSYLLLVVYVAVEATRTLVAGDHPRTSWVGVGLAAFTAATMPLLAAAKRDAGRRLGSAATVREATQNDICAYLSLALLAGLGLNATLGWWWADPVAALAIGAVAAREGAAAWRGEACGCC